jgi:hypothetical protein
MSTHQAQPTTPGKGFSPAWRRFLAEIESAHSALGYSRHWPPDDVCYFRGQADRSWPLLPSLYRQTRVASLLASRATAKLPQKKAAASELHDLCWQMESDLFFEFNARAREAHSGHLSSWDVLFMMQHHGVPTRLLDWTETFAVALYFAVIAPLPTSTAQRVIWMLNPFHLNAETWPHDISKGNADLIDPKNLGWDSKTKQYYTYDEILTEDGLFEFDLPTAIYPQLKNNRLLAQRGSFTIWGDGYEPLDSRFPPEDSTQNVLRCVELADDAMEDARHFLSLAGIDQHLLFPDLSGLASWLRHKNGFPM